MNPTTTTYALLGLLLSQPDSAYGLVERMRIHYGYFWPRARSHVFTEVKKLEALGWVAGVSEGVGRRPRRVLHALPEGRAALEAWLRTAPTSFSLEIEGLVRVYLAAFGSLQDLDRALAALEREAEAMLVVAREVVPAYLRGEGPPPADDVALRAILIDFLVHFAQLTAAWAARSRAAVAEWPDDPEERQRRALVLLAALPLGAPGPGPAGSSGSGGSRRR